MKTILKTFMVLALFAFVSKANAQSGNFILKEGNNGTQSTVANLTDAPGQAYNLKDRNSPYANDEARSVIIQNVRAGAVLSVYDSPKGDASDDYTVITVKRFVPYLVVEHFELNSFENDDIRYQRIGGGNLNGKVSFIRIN